MDAECVFFAISHGKLPCDGIGGAVKHHTAKFAETNKQSNSILMSGGNDTNQILWYQQGGGCEEEDGKAISRW